MGKGKFNIRTYSEWNFKISESIGIEVVNFISSFRTSGFRSPLVLIILALIFSCSSINYKNDLVYASPGVTNYQGLSVLVQGRTCKDLDGNPGACYFQHYRNGPLKIKVPGPDYQYEFKLTCTPSLSSNFGPIVKEAREDIDIEILPEKWETAHLNFFECIGRITPHGRGEVSNSFDVVVNLVNKEYIQQQVPYIDQEKLILGEYAYLTRIYTEKEIFYLHKVTSISKLKKLAGNRFCVITESYKGRSALFCNRSELSEFIK